jgi:hypothetical protein
LSVRKTGIGRWYSSLCDQEFDSELAALHYDSLQRMRSRPESEESKMLDTMPLPQLKNLVTEMTNRAEQVQGNLDWLQVQQEFVDANPEFLPCPKNGAALQAGLILRGKLTRNGVFVGTLDDVRETWLDLAEQNALDLREGAKLPQRPFDEAAAYAMSSEELQRRGRGWS